MLSARVPDNITHPAHAFSAWDAQGPFDGDWPPDGCKRESTYSWFIRPTLESRRGFGYGIRTAKAGPSNTAVRELMGNGAYTEAVLSLLRETDVEKAMQASWTGTWGSSGFSRGFFTVHGGVQFLYGSRFLYGSVFFMGYGLFQGLWAFFRVMVSLRSPFHRLVFSFLSF